MLLLSVLIILLSVQIKLLTVNNITVSKILLPSVQIILLSVPDSEIISFNSLEILYGTAGHLVL